MTEVSDELAAAVRDEWYPLADLLRERYAPPVRVRADTPAAIARRRRILLGHDEDGDR